MAALTTLLIVVAVLYVWIVRDSWMQEAFVVYGRSFRLAVQMKAWDILYRCGWRFFVVIVTICATLWLAYDAIVLNENASTSTTKIASGMLAALAVGMIPWRFAVVAYQRRLEIDSLINQITEAALRVAETRDMDTTLVPAGYENADDWTAWHPSHAEFASGDETSIWNRVVPVFYTSPTHPGTVVIPIDWENFAVWGPIPALPKVGEHLPFHGPGDSSFRLRSVRHPKACFACSAVLSAEMDLPDGD